MNPLFILAFITFAAIIAFLGWNLMSTRRHQKTGGHTSGVGGPNDPLAGATPAMRDPEEMRQSLDAADVRKREPHPSARV